MTKQEVLSLIIAGRRAAERRGGFFEVDRPRLEKMGLSRSDIKEVEAAADRIETYIESEFAALR